MDIIMMPLRPNNWWTADETHASTIADDPYEEVLLLVITSGESINESLSVDICQNQIEDLQSSHIMDATLGSEIVRQNPCSNEIQLADDRHLVRPNRVFCPWVIADGDKLAS